MGFYEEFEKIIFGFTMEAAELGGRTAVDTIEYGYIFHFEDKDAIKFLEKNAATLSESSLVRLKGNIDEVLIAGVKEGKSIKVIAKDVLGVFDDMKGYEAERIARTEVARGVNNGALVGYDNMGIKIVEYYANAGACPICAAHHGDLMTIDEAMNYIPLHPNCYCFWVSRPDITNKKVEGWKGLGEIPDKIMKGLGIDLAFRRTVMNPKALDKIYSKNVYHPNSPEKMRLIIENAGMGIIDNKGDLCLIMDHPEGGWNYIPVKHTEDYGLIVKSGYRIGPKRKTELKNKLENARERYGI